MATITTLIPAYKKDYLGEVFLGLQRQTCKDFRVILSDDSPGDEISALIRSGHFGALLRGLDLQVLQGPKNIRLNYRALVQAWGQSTPYVHLHMDDDLVYPDFYAAHLAAHATGRYCASVSRRWYSYEDSRPAHGVAQPACVTDSPLQVVPVQADALFQSVVPGCHNWLGEFSNMLLSAEGMAHWPQPPQGGLNYYGFPDVGYLLSAGAHLPVAVLRDHLGVFRQHGGQTTHNMLNHGGLVSLVSWVAIALHAWREGRVSYVQSAGAIIHIVGEYLRRYGEDDPTLCQLYEIVQHRGHSLDELYQAFEPFWQALLARHPATAPAGVVPTATAPAALPAPARHAEITFV